MGQTAGAGVSIGEEKKKEPTLPPVTINIYANPSQSNGTTSLTVTTNPPKPSTNYTEIHMTPGAGVNIDEKPQSAKPYVAPQRYPTAPASPADTFCPTNTSANGPGSVITGYVGDVNGNGKGGYCRGK